MFHKKEIDNVYWFKKEHQLTDSLTKIRGDVSPLINTLFMESYLTQNKGHWYDLRDSLTQ